MSMVVADMAEAIRSAMGFPLPVSTELQGWATGVINEITSNGKTNHAPGTVTGSCPPGGLLSAGAAVSGTISGLSGSSMANGVKTGAGYPSVSSELSTFCSQIVSHIQTFGVVFFDVGHITGNCTNTPISSGPLANGAGTGGVINGLDGSILASAIHGAVGYPGSVSTKLTQFCTAMVTYIMGNAQVSYAPNSITGICPLGGGSLSAGTGTNGTIA